MRFFMWMCVLCVYVECTCVRSLRNVNVWTRKKVHASVEATRTTMQNGGGYKGYKDYKDYNAKHVEATRTKMQNSLQL